MIAISKIVSQYIDVVDCPSNDCTIPDTVILVQYTSSVENSGELC